MSDPSANQPPGHTDHPSRHSDFSAAGAEERVGKLVAEIGVVIRSADPDRRLELKELTETLLHDEVSTIAAQSQPVESARRRYGFNPLPLGIILIVLSIGFFVIVPLLSLLLAFIGTVLGVWGGIMSWRGNNREHEGDSTDS
jgi:hypothetical protein